MKVMEKPAPIARGKAVDITERRAISGVLGAVDKFYRNAMSLIEGPRFTPKQLEEATEAGIRG